MEKKELKFTDQEINVLLLALQKQPFEVVNDLVYNIVNQLKAIQIQQAQAKQVEVKPENNN